MPAKFHQFRHSGHRAVRAHDLADHAPGRKPRKPGEIDRGFCLACADQHSALAGAQREYVPGPRQVAGLAASMRELVGDGGFIVHLHDTRGMGIANASAALDAGCRVLDGSLGGLGGCPFAPGATGNVATEEVLAIVRGW